MRIAIVDVGTNSTRLFVADVEGGRVVAQLERATRITRLGAGVDANGRLNREAIERVLATLDDYRGRIEAHGAERRVAVLTSAVRDAANGEEFAHELRSRYGLEAFVLDGEEEARLTFLGATSERDPDDVTTTLVTDIGGGSTEFVIGQGREARFHVSTQMGAVRQTERHLHHDPPRREELDALATDVRAIIAAAVPEEQRRVEHAIGVAGTPTSLAAVAQELEPYDPDRVQGYLLGREESEALLARLAALPVSERREVPGLHPDRAPTIVAGAAILVEIMRLFDLERIEVSEHDILRGAALDFAGTQP
ncbi:MAG TPA: Ppx/GppA phosphatase family protein [Solirubrobacteraceae bacterium]|nr:Ppx/GppA phosphatase family protein [Solirubrobacteraceae bacterium]